MLLILLALLAGCDLFRVRDSDPPTKPAPWNSYATSWDLCLENLEYCYVDSRNAIKYYNLFAANYSFHFSAQDINDYNLAPTWTATQEQDMLLNLHNQSDSIQVTLFALPSQPDEITASEARIYREYELRRYAPGLAQPEYYKGEFELQFQKSGAYWYISKWYDYRAPGHSSWGKMKYDFSQ